MRSPAAALRTIGRMLGVVSLTALQACSLNPLVKWEAPPRTSEPRMVLDDAFKYSDAARQGYMEKMREQVGAQALLSSGLIGLGAIVTGLAIYKAHRDAIIGGALLGATGLALGTWNLDKRRILIHEAAINAFNCADRAIVPLNMSVGDYNSLLADLKALSAASATATVRIGDTERALNQWIAGTRGAADAAGPFRAAITAAEQAVIASRQTQDGGQALRREIEQAEEHLKITVRQIDKEAQAALADTQKDLNKVPTVIASLAGMAGSIVPGSGVEQTISDALKAAGKVGKQESGASQIVPPPAVMNAVANMNDAVRRLLEADSAVNARVKAVVANVKPKALEGCGIGELNLAMSVDHPKISVAAGMAATRSISIKGGAKPYGVKVNGTEVPGVSIVGPDRNASSFQVKVSADVKTQQTANFVVVDSSDPERSVPFAVEINATDAPATKVKDAVVKPPPKPKTKAKTDPAQPVKEAASVPATALSLAKLVADVKEFEMSGIKMQIPSPPRPADDGTVQVSIACKPKPAQCFKLDDVRAKYLEPLKGKVDAAGEKLLRFSNFAPGGCVCP